MSVERKILSWCKNLLEKNNGKEVEFDISSLIRHLKSENVGEFLIENIDMILENLRKEGNLLYYYDEEKKNYVLVKVITD